MNLLNCTLVLLEDAMFKFGGQLVQDGMDRVLVNVVDQPVEQVPVCNGVGGLYGSWRSEDCEEQCAEHQSLPWEDHDDGSVGDRMDRRGMEE